MSMSVRKVLLPLHLWAGLTLGLILVVMSVTGALLVWRKPVETRLNQDKFVVAPGGARLAPDDLVARARVAHPGAELESIRYYGDPTAPFLAYYTDKEFVHLNPYTGQVLGIRKRYGEGLGWIEGLHKFLQIEPSIGENITGYTALTFGFIILSGIVLWWPATRKALKAGLTLNRKLKGRPWNLSLHKALGAYAAVILLVSVSTGVPISLDWAKDALYPLTGSTKILPPTPVTITAPMAFSGFDAAARSVIGVFPNAVETYIPLPKRGIVAAYVIEASAAHPNSRSYVWLEPATALVIQARPYAQAAAGLRLYYWMMSLHTGVMGGTAWRIILLLGALSVPVLAYTGTASYLRRKYGKTVPQPATARAASAPVPLAQLEKASD
ncbi:MAG: PepSY-associated TM helix domain-containing protein [Lacunisphaera sp.]|nr:PepSY-associated TM helix domain-containing protein [Lacunisphaera sp.]